MEQKNFLLMIVILLLYFFIVADGEGSIPERLEKELPKIIWFTALGLIMGLTGNEEMLFWTLILVLLGTLFINADKVKTVLGGLL